MNSLPIYLGRFHKFRNFLGRKVWRLFLAAIGIGAALFLIESSFIFIVQGFLSAVGLVEESKLSLPLWYPRSLSVALLLLVLFGVARGLTFSFKTYVAGMTHQIFNQIQRSRIIEFSLSHASQISSHDMMELFSERVANAGSSLACLSGFTLNGTSFVFLALLGVRLAPKEMVLGAVLLSLFYFPLKLMGEQINAYGEELVENWKKANRLLLEGMRNNFLLRVYGLIPGEVQRGRGYMEEFESLYRNYYSRQSLKNSVPIIAGVIVICTITLVSIRYIGTPPMRLIGFYYIFIRMAQTAAEMNAMLSEFRLYLPGFKQLYSWHLRMNAALAQENSDATTQATFANPGGGVEVELENVAFAYAPGQKIFENVSLRVPSGETLVIQGESGTGKSTLLSLILGLKTPTQGRVLINSQPLREKRGSLCSILGYVGPDPYLVAGTIRENLLYTHPDPASVSETKIWECLGRAQLSADIAQLPSQLEEPLNEQAQLSTGQKQRLAIARALLREPRLLILDEASANLDSVTEGKFVDSLSGALGQLTTIIISHKASFDRIASQKLMVKREGSRPCDIVYERLPHSVI